LLNSNRNSFRVMFDRIASVYFIREIYFYCSIGNRQAREPALCQLYRHTFVRYVTVRCPSVRLSRRSTAAATCSWIAAARARATGRLSISAAVSGQRHAAIRGTRVNADLFINVRIYIGWSDDSESMVTIWSPFCGYNTMNEWTNEWVSECVSEWINIHLFIRIYQHRYNTIKTVKSRTVSTGQKGSKSTYNCPNGNALS